MWCRLAALKWEQEQQKETRGGKWKLPDLQPGSPLQPQNEPNPKCSCAVFIQGIQHLHYDM